MCESIEKLIKQKQTVSDHLHSILPVVKEKAKRNFSYLKVL